MNEGNCVGDCEGCGDDGGGGGDDYDKEVWTVPNSHVILFLNVCRLDRHVIVHKWRLEIGWVHIRFNQVVFIHLTIPNLRQSINQSIILSCVNSLTLYPL